MAWYSHEHPQLGTIELGGVNAMYTWTNAPSSMLKAEVAPHTDVAIYQAMASPRLEIKLAEAHSLGGDVWRVRVGVANTGWLPTDVTQHARSMKLVLPVTIEIGASSGAIDLVEGEARVRVGQLAGRAKYLLDGGAMSDGTPDRHLHTCSCAGEPARLSPSPRLIHARHVDCNNHAWLSDARCDDQARHAMNDALGMRTRFGYDTTGSSMARP